MSKRKPKCDCHLYERQVCDICQGTDKRKPFLDISEATPESLGAPYAQQEPNFGYHTVKIKKGKLGEISKLQEELDELKDAEAQGVKILIHCELADLYGALRKYARKYELSMKDLEAMATLTEIAFRDGYR